MSKRGKPSFPTKKCPYCSTHLEPIAVSCSYCKKKVGPVNKHGIAEKPIDWKAYTACFLSWGALFAYFWVLGWSEPLIHFCTQLFIQMRIWLVKVVMAIWGVVVSTWNTTGEIISTLINRLSG